MKNAARFDPDSTFSCFRVYCGGCRVKVGDKFMSDEPTHKVFCVLKETTDVYLRTESQRALLSQFLPTSMTLRDKPPTMQQLSLVSRSLESSTNHQQLSVPMSQCLNPENWGGQSYQERSDGFLQLYPRILEPWPSLDVAPACRGSRQSTTGPSSLATCWRWLKCVSESPELVKENLRTRRWWSHLPPWLTTMRLVTRRKMMFLRQILMKVMLVIMNWVQWRFKSTTESVIMNKLWRMSRLRLVREVGGQCACPSQGGRMEAGLRRLSTLRDSPLPSAQPPSRCPSPPASLHLAQESCIHDSWSSLVLVLMENQSFTTCSPLLPSWSVSTSVTTS